MICPICKIEIKPLELKFMVSNDIPYFNIYVHKECIATVNITEDIIREIYEFYLNSQKSEKTKR